MYDILINRPLTKSQKRCECCCAYAWRNKCVFNIDLKRSGDSSGIQMSLGSEFQTTGPETRKLLGPKQRVLVRGTVRSSKSQSHVSLGANLPDRIAGAAEVCRTSTMEGVVDEDRDLEVDTLTDGKPVELISQHSAQEWYGRPSSCSRLAWLPRWVLLWVNHKSSSRLV